MIDRDDLLRRTDLAALLDELSPTPATRLGHNARWRCIDPGHDDQHPSITMFTDRRGTQRWKCWSGGHGGTAIDALLIARGGTIADALTELEQRTGRPHDIGQRRTAPQKPPAADRPTPIDPALLEYVAACERILWHPAGREVLDYLVTERGLAPDVLEANHGGADPGPQALRRAPGLPRGGTAAVLPTLDLNGGVTYVQARYLDHVDGRPKYDNPARRLAPNPRIGWVTTARTNDRCHLFVCEGVIDALSAASTGSAAVAVLGATYIDDRVAREVAKGAAGRKIVLAFDGDPAGRNAAETLASSLTKVGYPSHIVPLPDGSDINAVLRRDGQWIHRQLDTFGSSPHAWPIVSR